jgi:hypothetical protein
VYHHAVDFNFGSKWKYVTLVKITSTTIIVTQPARAERKLPKTGLSFGAVERRGGDVFIV